MPNMDLDEIDLRILNHMQGDARLTNVELAERVGLSPSPCLRRLRKLEKDGVIQGYMTFVDQTKVGLPVSVFVSVALKEQSEAALEEFEESVSALPEVMECYLMTGTSDYLMRVVTQDLADYERFLKNHLTRIPAIASIQSSFALKQVTYRTALPLSEGDSHS
ncbi:MAG: Lrp/AsnC family transcriptional regulator [Rhodospirillaceae bacterium]|jgi:Lrp/AsnC family transcriptional regulator, leucine-responsive regulatory protein|nr:Lrp/AsnC family transcriptional regulator [Rhodospirillaceae bacterium]MBT5242075.1 Lrp/AsnC family transcriptional regulator [Rhodospirillaceae bacterium]MBT5565801.1 Lrp/AsnC family transcriptional regulator [Rhodospirillaceae bacterium]MBT6090306.1 Lrp/AsnC family transcriptional regulator [Rhodospirillaceae bacterium]